MKQKNYIETCWEEIEKPRNKKQHPHKNKAGNLKKEESATPLEMALLFICIILCLACLLIGTTIR